MKYLMEYIRKIWKVPALAAGCAFLMGAVFFLYDLPVEPVIYGAALCAVAGLASFFAGYVCYCRKKKNLLYMKENILVNLPQLSRPWDGNEAIYQELLRELCRDKQDGESDRVRFLEELTDYYTMWVHQIKTPISALRLLLQEEGENRDALSELFKIEQYVEMVLGYLRTEDMSGDMQFAEQELDGIIRGQIHKYARIFVGKKLSLNYEGVEEKVLTDAKWLGFVIGQVLSNALKYTKNGGISIYMSQARPHTLVIEDTGTGVRPEDLPRVFEKGFTGYNGRSDTRSTGIGLYLSAKIMKKLGHKITLESDLGKGTRVYLELGRKPLEIY